MKKMHVLGAADIEDILNKLPEAIAQTVVGQGLGAGARVISSKAKQNVRNNPTKDTGGLEQMIRTRATKGKATVSVRSGTLILTRKGRSKPSKVVPARTAHLPEFGTRNMPAEPFMRPALDEGGPEAVVAIAETMGKGIEREARALAAGRKSFATGQKII